MKFRRRLLHVILDQELAAYQHGEVEEEDFLYSFNAICEGNSDVEEEALKYVLKTAESLGQYLETRHPTNVRGGHRLSKKHVCQQPYNQALHQLGRECGETRLIEGEDDVKILSAELKASSHITVLAHAPPKLIREVDEVDLLTVRTRKRVFAVLPKVFPQTVQAVGAALRNSVEEQVVFVHKGNKLRKFCKEVLQWVPENVMDVFDACLEKGWGARDNMDYIAADVVKGNFCRRGWRFDAVAIPSSTVIEHRRINASLIHEFGLKMTGDGGL
jgi:hypothetical protein